MKKLLLSAFLLLFLSSCREEIIPPNNPAGNVNQPVRETMLNSYSYIINAGDITHNLYDYIKFDNSRAQVFISIVDYASGSVEVSLIGKSKRIIFSKVAETDINGEYARINNEVPDAVIINFKDFTGKFKISINRY
jgi:hypothetical protein